MKQNWGEKIRAEMTVWRVGALPGLTVIGLIILLRLAGVFQFLEWTTLDLFLRLRPPEATDERILIVGIDEEDIRRVGTYPIPDRDIAALLRTLAEREPRAIGLGLVRNLSIKPGHQELIAAFNAIDNLVAIEKVLPDRSGEIIPAPPNFPPERVGFSDGILDADGSLRRSLLGTADRQRNYKFSFAIRLSEMYLAKEGIALDNGLRDWKAMRFGKTELKRIFPNSGAYIRADNGGNQILINFRSGREPFRIVSLHDVQTGKVPSEWIRDRIVLIGNASFSVPGLLKSGAISGVNPRLVYGIEIQAHQISQIINAVLEHRPLLNTWSDGWEYLWIFAWGFLGISLGRFIHSPLEILLGFCAIGFCLTAACYGMSIIGFWIPFVPAFLALFINGTGLTAALFYRYERNLKAIIKERQFIIDQTFDTIHNGPLQTLARLLRQAREETLPPDQLISDLQQLNQELRTIYESIRRETLTQGNNFYFGSDLELDLNAPTHELLYEVYSNTLSRNFPCFKTLKVKIVNFKPLDSRFLSLEQKRSLCRFLEEALCNAGKHAEGITRLEITCIQDGSGNLLRIADNGMGERFFERNSGRGTRQAKNLARQLGGKFQRFPNTPKGTVCELSWLPRRMGFWRF